MSKIVFDQSGTRKYETGVKNVILFPMNENGVYQQGVAWNGVTAITESPSGAEATPVYADDIKYLNLMSVEEFAATIEALYYPDEFAACNGLGEIAEGVIIGQQERLGFGLAYKTTLGNDTSGNNYGYKWNLIYGALAAPSEQAHNTINDSPEAGTMSWEISTTPVSVTGFKPTASLSIDSTKVSAADMASFESIILGVDAVPASGTEGQAGYVPAVEAVTSSLPLPDAVAALITPAQG